MDWADALPVIIPCVMAVCVIVLIGYVVVIAIPKILDIHTKELQDQRTSYTQTITVEMARIQTVVGEVIRSADAAWHAVEQHDYAAQKRHEDLMTKLRAIEQVVVGCVKGGHKGGPS